MAAMGLQLSPKALGATGRVSTQTPEAWLHLRPPQSASEMHTTTQPDAPSGVTVVHAMSSRPKHLSESSGWLREVNAGPWSHSATHTPMLVAGFKAHTPVPRQSASTVQSFVHEPPAAPPPKTGSSAAGPTQRPVPQSEFCVHSEPKGTLPPPLELPPVELLLDDEEEDEDEEDDDPPDEEDVLEELDVLLVPPGLHANAAAMSAGNTATEVGRNREEFLCMR